MHRLLPFIFLLSTAYSEIIEPLPNDATPSPTYMQPGVSPNYVQPGVSPSYVQPGVNPTYTQPTQPSAGVPSGSGQVYGQTNPVQPTYNQDNVYPAYGYPEYGYGYQNYPVKKNEETGMVKTLGAILPVIRQAFHLLLRIAGKVGLFLVGGAALLLVGGAFTAAVCTVTPICTFTFMGYGLSNEQVRSLMSPDRISIATNLVNEAIDKYAKLQGVMDAKNL